MSEIAFVNIFGDPVDTTKRVKPPKRDSRAAEKYHKGWAVVGVSPEAADRAARDRAESIASAIRHNEEIDAGKRRYMTKRQVPEPFDRAAWIETAPLKPARTKPFEIEESARQCAQLARKSGWLRVEVRRIAKGVE